MATNTNDYTLVSKMTARTAEVLSDKEIMAQLEAGKQDDVKSRDFEEVAKEMGI